MAPLLTYTATVAIDGNGFVASFVAGIAAVLVYSLGIPWQVGLFCLAVLTVIRMVPVVLSLVGSRMPWRERVLAGALGPRGTTTIVFGLLAFDRRPDGSAADTFLVITVTCVLGSVVLHGMGGQADDPPSGQRDEHEPMTADRPGRDRPFWTV